MAITDQLTGLHNRRYMSRHLDTLLANAKKNDRPLAFVIMDIDFFKQVNDRHGHDAGDTAIRNLAAVMREALRANDLVARWGGEEFVALLPMNGRKEALLVAERLRGRIAAASFPVAPGTVINMTASIGLVGARGGGESLDSFVRRADLALYEAKAKGRNRVVFRSG